MGYIREKEQSYHDASVFYGHAWLYTNRVNPSMGFRLAFNYLKFKQYNEAIEVCHKVCTVDDITAVAWSQICKTAHRSETRLSLLEILERT
nr:tetratricopeptide repeat protein 21B-like [Salvelinus alpinus]